MFSHVLLIHSRLTHMWTVRLMLPTNKHETGGEDYQCFDCGFTESVTARKVAEQLSKDLGIRLEESD